MAALNRYDAVGMDAEMYFPHVRFAGGTIAVYEKSGNNPMDLLERLRREDGWDHNAWNRHDIVHRGGRKSTLFACYRPESESKWQAAAACRTR